MLTSSDTATCPKFDEWDVWPDSLQRGLMNKILSVKFWIQMTDFDKDLAQLL